MIFSRYVACICLLQYLFYFVFLTVRQYHPVNFIFSASSVLLVGVLVASYKIKRSDVVVWGYSLIMYAVCFVAGPSIGWICSGYGYLFVTLMLLWYDSTKGMKYKLIVSAGCALAVCLIFGVRGGGFDLVFRSYDYELLLIVNNLFLCVSVSMLSYFLCRENVADERKLLQYNEKLKTMAGVDPLTGLMNRRAIGERFEELIHATDCVTVAMGDIDFFKKVNDTRGHDCGDYVLKTLSAMFKEFMEDKGYVSRWGGEEFVFVFQGINGDDTYPMLEELRRNVEARQFEFFSHSFNITMTFGVEEYSPMFGTDEAIKKADEKLYIGKEGGRNQVVY